MEWRSRDRRDVRKARELFKKLTQEGWFAVLDSTNGKGSRRILEFESEIERIRFVPVAEGG